MAFPTERPYINWSQLSPAPKPRVDPNIVIRPEEMEDAYDIFRKLSHKAAHCRFDVPLEHQVIVAYAHYPDSREPDKAVGVVTYWISKETISKDEKTNFMDDYFHQISFLFVDPQFQRQGIGAKLLHSAITSIKRSGVKRPIHLEGAKSAVKFFKKQRFISFGKAENGARRGIFSTLFNMQHNFS